MQPIEPQITQPVAVKKTALETLREWWDFLEGKKTALGGLVSAVGTLGEWVYPQGSAVWVILQRLGAIMAAGGGVDKLRRVIPDKYIEQIPKVGRYLASGDGTGQTPKK